MHRIIIDTDPGLDDALALLLALAYPEVLEVLAVTTVAGNQTIDKVTANALRILSLAGSRVPVAAGAAKPLERDLVTAAKIHGESGLGGVVLPDPAYASVAGSATELLWETVEGSPDPVTLVPIGPLTNMAELLRAHPEARERIELISFMGGGISGGNTTASAEFNVYVDPEAAGEVFSSGIPLVMSGLDVTMKAYVSYEESRALRGRGRASQLAADLLDFYEDRYRRAGLPGPAIHDACAVAYLINPELFTGEDLHVEVETRGDLTRGATVADRRPGTQSVPNAKVLLDVDRPAFVELLFEGLARIDRRVAS